MNVLIVDDEPLEIEQLHYLIQEQYPAWNLYGAEDAAQAKRMLEEHSIDLALLDIHLPGESGLDLCVYIKEQYETECIMVTAFEDFQYAKQALQLHVFDYIVKPVISREFYLALEKFVKTFGYLEKVSPSIEKVIQLIHNGYETKLNLKELADKVHMAPNYLSRKFSEEVGMNFQEYVISYRITKAKSLLKQQPGWSIHQVSEKSGFTSLHHFSSTFKKIVQLSPSQYRESLQHD
ncbi:response regulator transcription factor [Fictibacillus fluitans]|uniref:Response regulator n=1 Tax=Fictibacillus fluitans TaxID=3058422 RepID=A0ABT8HXT3_9BACL|nr:response regulator [Fictibacillus sp. NE201]MDN4525062.1 response regulator [Fictibacillus sp. NE201]